MRVRIFLALALTCVCAVAVRADEADSNWLPASYGKSNLRSALDAPENVAADNYLTSSQVSIASDMSGISADGSGGYCNGSSGNCCNNMASSDCGSNSCCQQQCHVGLFDCCCVCPPRGWFVGGGVNVLRPQWQTNQAFAVETFSPGAAAAFSSIEFDYGYTVSPFANLGYVSGSGLGIRGSFWRFDASATANFAPVAPVGGIQGAAPAAPLGLVAVGATINPMQADTRLQFEVWDIELSQQLVCNCWWWEFAGGIRHLRTSQTYNVTTNGPIGTIDDITSGHRFDGNGPTLAMKGQRQLGCSNFSLYGQGRGSILFGTSSQQVALSAANGTLGATSTQSNRSVLGIVELDLGINYQRSFGRFTVVASGAVVGQYWSGIGNAANVDVFNANATDETMNRNIGMGLFGAKGSLQIWF